MKIYVAYPEENPELKEKYLSIYKGNLPKDCIYHRKSVQELTNDEKDLLLDEILILIEGLTNTLDLKLLQQFLEDIKKEKNNG